MERTCIIFLLLLAMIGLVGAGTVLADEPVIQQSSVWVNADQLNLRTGPDVTASSMGMLNRGEALILIQSGSSWSQVKSSRLGEGWVASQYLTDQHAEEVSRGNSRGRFDDLLAQAKRWLGIRYVYGGESPTGFDCSGFTLYVYRTAGVMLPHNALEQARLGTSVSRNELVPGDLIFFMTCGSTFINHVGIYIGDGLFIHASSGRGYVTISSLTEGYYLQHYAGASRFLNTSDTSVSTIDVPDTVAHSILDERTSG